MKTLFAVLLIFLLAGCAAQVVSSSPRTVVVRAGSVMVKDAQNLANIECGSHGRYARLGQKSTPNEYIFDCVN